MLDSTLIMLVLVIFTALAFDYINGFHDTANAIATSVATRALRPSHRQTRIATEGSGNGQLDAAFTMLLREEIRSWLYPIKMGATTIWERWDGIAEDGSISGGELASAAEGSEGSMISFNHYAYGAVVDWIYRNVGGIAPTAPGYENVSIAPHPHPLITSCKSAIQTGYGRLAVDWHLVDGDIDGQLDISLEIPFGITATLDGPFGDGRSLTHGQHRLTLRRNH